MSKTDAHIQILIEQARAAYANAYAPYSHYKVGAALLGDDGRIYTGCNVENAVYPLTLCAERVAIAKAVSEGVKHIKALAVVTANGGSPCGSCRQVIREFGNDDLTIAIASLDGSYEEYTLIQLLPHSFSAVDLPELDTK